MIAKKLGLRIAELRRAKKLTQQQLAEKSRYSVEFISLVERGVNAPSVAGCELIAKALNVPVSELFVFGGGLK
ncbi:MAG: helix-turn-helix transcriptional regulator [Opitutaceae bacterium]|jgi:transcriptional regulator with XRE-family HTH domain